MADWQMDQQRAMGLIELLSSSSDTDDDDLFQQVMNIAKRDIPKVENFMDIIEAYDDKEVK